MQPLILFLSLALLLAAIAQRIANRPMPPSPVAVAVQIRARAAAAPAPRPAPAAPAAAVSAPLRFEAAQPVATPEADAMRARLRDRYITARFPGIVSSSAAFADTEGVITAARLLFEEDRYGDALELLQLAIEQPQAPRALELERLEITYLHRDTVRYVMLARQFKDAHPDSDEWGDVARLGRALSPAEPLFASGPAEPQAHAHYGPWPHTPNWIHASWDLTGDVLAAEFHQAMRHEREKGVDA
jgi:hypothetical protein